MHFNKLALMALFAYIPATLAHQNLYRRADPLEIRAMHLEALEARGAYTEDGPVELQPRDEAAADAYLQVRDGLFKRRDKTTEAPLDMDEVQVV
ncbi:hypothetical protein MMC17_000645 [Xylographa soralifera]|nr:hypothetical protein [Xylographa soralifera]